LKRAASWVNAESSVRSTWPIFCEIWVPARLAAFLSPAQDMLAPVLAADEEGAARGASGGAEVSALRADGDGTRGSARRTERELNEVL